MHGTVVVFAGDVRYTPSPGFMGLDHFSYRFSDTLGQPSNLGAVTVAVDPEGCGIECPPAVLLELWPPNHHYREVDLNAALGAPGLSFVITSITQDEPIDSTGDGNTVCDGSGVGGSVASLRAERKGDGNGRVYRVSYVATGPGGTCAGELHVAVPHSQDGDPAVDDGQLFDSTEGCD
jgi:hypothetical protein